jgi:hypothetical protein
MADVDRHHLSAALARRLLRGALFTDGKFELGGRVLRDADEYLMRRAFKFGADHPFSNFADCSIGTGCSGVYLER